MTAIMKEEKTMDAQTKTYLQMYEEFINGYKQYKMEKAEPWTKNEKSDRAVH